jgi:pSer/pThr/pTyr-binding forkhead associated (FHA) protein
MAVTLLVRPGAPAGEDPTAQAISYDLPRIVLGRGDGCDLRLPDLSVSHRHASIRQRGSEYILVDEGSTNGTFIGSVRLHPQSPRALRHGEMVRLGRVWIEVRIEPVAPTAHAPQVTRELALARVADAMDQQGEPAHARLKVTEGPDQGAEFELGAGQPLILGRGRDASFPINVEDASRRHAQVLRRNEVLLVRDLGSRNGTFSSKGPVPADTDLSLRPGDSFSIGDDVFLFEYPAYEALKELENASDEPMDPHEEVPVPPSSVATQQQAEAAEPVQGAPILDPEAPAAPLPRVMTPRPRRAPASQQGWNKTDIAIVGLAILVLMLSAIGLMWLFRSG